MAYQHFLSQGALHNKLVAASFLYQYWYRASKLLKTYLGIGVVTLVLITSAGIFGYLSNAYQGATIDFEKQTTTLFYQEDRLTQLEEDMNTIKNSTYWLRDKKIWRK